MANKNSNVPYDQIPHIVINHPNTKPDHLFIMCALYKVLKDKKQCIYSNESLTTVCKITERTLRRRLNELEKWGFINRIGESYARRFSLGLLFNTEATMAGYKSNTPAIVASTPAKSERDPGHGGRDTKHSTNPSTKENISFSNLNHPETKELEHCVKHNVPLSSDFKYLQLLLDDVLKDKLQK